MTPLGGMGTGTQQAPGPSETPSWGRIKGGAGMAANPHEARQAGPIGPAACRVLRHEKV